jgi:hypothetical protein
MLSIGLLVVTLLVLSYYTISYNTFTPSPREVDRLYNLVEKIGTTSDTLNKFRKAFPKMDAVQYYDIRNECADGCTKDELSRALA